MIMDNSREKRLQMAIMLKQAKEQKNNLADLIGVKTPMPLPNRPLYTPPKKEKEIDPEVKAEGEKIKKQIEREAKEREKISKDKMKKRSYLQFKQAGRTANPTNIPKTSQPITPAAQPKPATSTANTAGAAPSNSNRGTPAAQPSVEVRVEQNSDGGVTQDIKGNPADVKQMMSNGEQPSGGIFGNIVNGVKAVAKDPVGAVNAAKEGIVEGAKAVGNGIKGFTQHSEMLQNNEAYNRGLNDPNNPIKLDEGSFNSEEWRNLKTDDERTAYITKLIQDWGYNKAGIAVRENGMAAVAKNPDLVPKDLNGVLSNEANYNELKEALSHGDMEFLNYMQRMQSSMGDEKAASYFSQVWSNIPEEKQEELLGTMKTAAWNNIKADPLSNIPKAIALWFKMKGWDQLGEFAQNPMNFYLTLGGLLVGGTALAGAAFGNGGSQQPIINVGNGQSNPFYNNEI